MTLHDVFVALGIDPSVLAAGTAGGLLRALSRKKFKMREIFVSPISGCLAAAYLTAPAVHIVRVYDWPPLPAEPDQTATYAIAFLIGAMAMWISDIAADAIARRVWPPKRDSDEDY
ncbi:MAG: hypothetical protein E5W82_10905 [Mesorhizobium sp.]|nr:MAG: hypothetical protein E5W82_10905 [Mesorhizobium sp.]